MTVMLYSVIAHAETSHTDHRGATWLGSVGLPTFFVDAYTPEAAQQVIVRTLVEGRTLQGPIHFTYCEHSGNGPVYSVHVLRPEDLVPPGTGVVHRLVPERVVPVV